MSHARKRTHGSSNRKTKQEEIPASQDPMAEIDPVEEYDIVEEENKENIQPSSPIKKPRIELVETFDNKQVFQPLSSTYRTEEVKECTALVPHKEQTTTSTQFHLQINGQIVEFKRDKTGYAKIIKQLIEQEAANLGYLTMGMKLMLQDIRVSTYYYFKFFPPTKLQFYDTTFLKDNEEVPTTSVKCTELQSSYLGLEFDGSVQRAMFAELAPLGDYDPFERNKRPCTLKKAKNKCNFSLEDSQDHPEFNYDMQDERKWLAVARELGLDVIKWDPKSKPYRLLVEAGFKPTGNEQERSAYSAEFDMHVRPAWKVSEKNPGQYPFSYMASDKAFKLCSKQQAYEFDTKKETYIVPGDIQEIKDFQKKTLPRKVPYKYKDPITGENKEVLVQQRYVHHDIPIFEAGTGRFIPMHERKEIHAYEDAEQTQFIEPPKRKRDIEDREWVIPRKRIVFTFKDKDATSPWTIGMAQKLVRIQKHLPPDVHVTTARTWDEKNAPPEKLPQGRAIMSDDEEQGFLKRIQEQQRAEMDAAMLACDIPSSS